MILENCFYLVSLFCFNFSFQLPLELAFWIMFYLIPNCTTFPRGFCSASNLLFYLVTMYYWTPLLLEAVFSMPSCFEVLCFVLTISICRTHLWHAWSIIGQTCKWVWNLAVLWSDYTTKPLCLVFIISGMVVLEGRVSMSCQPQISKMQSENFGPCWFLELEWSMWHGWLNQGTIIAVLHLHVGAVAFEIGSVWVCCLALTLFSWFE